MRKVEVDGTNVLLVKDNDKFYALGAKCTHYGAPLASGAFCVVAVFLQYIACAEFLKTSPAMLPCQWL